MRLELGNSQSVGFVMMFFQGSSPLNVPVVEGLDVLELPCLVDLGSLQPGC